MKKIILLCIPLLLIGCGDSDENANDPLIGKWKQISETRYFFEEGVYYGRACLDEGYPSVAEFFSDGTYNDQFWECMDNGDGTVEIEEYTPTIGGTWEQVGAAGNYLIFDPNEEEPNEEIAFLEFNSDFSQFSNDNGEYIVVFERQ